MAGDGAMQIGGLNELITLGLVGVRVDRPEDVGAAWDQVLAAGRPALLEEAVDPNVLSMPPHISCEQPRKFTRAALRDAEALGFLKQAFKEGTAGVLHKK